MRWNTSRCATSSTRSGTNWAALAPEPITATRRPLRSTVWSQAAEWKAGPAKSWRPSTAGNDGRFSWPTAHTTASKVSVVDAVRSPPDG